MTGLQTSFDVQEITSLEQLQAVEDDWRELWRNCSAATPFQSPEWLIPWWRVLGEGDLHALTLRIEQRLVAFVPLFVYHDSRAGSRLLLLLGTGNSDYMDALVEPGWRDLFQSVFRQLLANSECHWDVCDLQQLRQESVLLNLPRGTFAEEVCDGEPCPFLPLSANIEQVRESLPRNLAGNLAYYSHRAEKAGAVQYVRASAENCAVLLDHLVRLESRRWNSSGKWCVLEPEALRRFHYAAAPQLVQSGLGRLYGLSLNQQIIAVFYGFLCNRRMSCYLGAFDPAFTQLSPGNLLIWHAIEQAVHEGASEFDFLRGREAYKYRWGAVDRVTFRRRIMRHVQELKH